MPRAHRSPDKPLVRRDADGRQGTAPTWETLTERLIREAQADGRFDDLPDQGQPLRLEDDVYAGEMATAQRVLRDAGAAPLMASRLRSELERLADSHDDAVRRLEGLAPTPRQQRPCTDREALRARLDAVLEVGSDAP